MHIRQTPRVFERTEPTGQARNGQSWVKIPGERISGACEAPEVRFEISFLSIL